MSGPPDPLEEQLRVAFETIGKEASSEEEAPSRHGATSPKKWRQGVAKGIALGLIATVGSLALWLGTNGFNEGLNPAVDPAGKGQTMRQWVACAQVILEGDVVAIQRAPEPGRLVVTLSVDDWIKPGEGPRIVDLNVVDPRKARVRDPWKRGSHVLTVVPAQADEPADTFRSAELRDYRAQIEQILPVASSECPKIWR